MKLHWKFVGTVRRNYKRPLRKEKQNEKKHKLKKGGEVFSKFCTGDEETAVDDASAPGFGRALHRSKFCVVNTGNVFIAARIKCMLPVFCTRNFELCLVTEGTDRGQVHTFGR